MLYKSTFIYYSGKTDVTTHATRHTIKIKQVNKKKETFFFFCKATSCRCRLFSSLKIAVACDKRFFKKRSGKTIYNKNKTKTFWNKNR